MILKSLARLFNLIIFLITLVILLSNTNDNTKNKQIFNQTWQTEKIPDAKETFQWKQNTSNEWTIKKPAKTYTFKTETFNITSNLININNNKYIYWQEITNQKLSFLNLNTWEIKQIKVSDDEFDKYVKTKLIDKKWLFVSMKKFMHSKKLQWYFVNLNFFKLSQSLGNDEPEVEIIDKDYLLLKKQGWLLNIETNKYITSQLKTNNLTKLYANGSTKKEYVYYYKDANKREFINLKNGKIITINDKNAEPTIWAMKPKIITEMTKKEIYFYTDGDKRYMLNLDTFQTESITKTGWKMLNIKNKVEYTFKYQQEKNSYVYEYLHTIDLKTPLKIDLKKLKQLNIWNKNNYFVWDKQPDNTYLLYKTDDSMVKDYDINIGTNEPASIINEKKYDEEWLKIIYKNGKHAYLTEKFRIFLPESQIKNYPTIKIKLEQYYEIQTNATPDSNNVITTKDEKNILYWQSYGLDWSNKKKYILTHLENPKQISYITLYLGQKPNINTFNAITNENNDVLYWFKDRKNFGDAEKYFIFSMRLFQKIGGFDEEPKANFKFLLTDGKFYWHDLFYINKKNFRIIEVGRNYKVTMAQKSYEGKNYQVYMYFKYGEGWHILNYDTFDTIKIEKEDNFKIKSINGILFIEYIDGLKLFETEGLDKENKKNGTNFRLYTCKTKKYVLMNPLSKKWEDTSANDEPEITTSNVDKIVQKSGSVDAPQIKKIMTTNKAKKTKILAIATITTAIPLINVFTILIIFIKKRKI